MEFVCFSFCVGLLFFINFLSFKVDTKNFMVPYVCYYYYCCYVTYLTVESQEKTLFHTNNCTSAKPACSANLPLCHPTVAVIITILCSNVHSKKCAVCFQFLPIKVKGAFSNDTST